MGSRFKGRVVVTILVVYGIYSTTVGSWMLVAPESMFDTIGGFGIRNAHYIFDLAAFELPLGLLYFGAVRWPSWRVPTLAFATLHYLLHSISHLIDIHGATPPWIGVFDFLVVGVGAAVHLIGLWLALSAQNAIRR